MVLDSACARNSTPTTLFFDTLLLNKGFVSARIVHAWGNQLVPKRLLKPSDTLHKQCRHIEHMHEEV